MLTELQRRANVSHWLSQSESRGEARRKSLARDDVQFVSVPERHGVAWRDWNMRGGFGLLVAGNRATAVAEALTQFFGQRP